ncbi:hypothetical protein DICPUDRAFT_54227 [Dictyostelium purpureum]|uniref:Exonuclease domain-containing protein n=1 Tax=Dictyostelium purpureum TaxID=5786 RepID=F0ZG40_DICPU|nr:uncharacterized protein DICPUDRAFT_54227 [Dictyostelium purpureum]EGC37092.1 hypothetical protein DICPUDRAFT_54227 [Dictyostelium purpureum]|eukprot:XP_003286373.1 hypothetical protein DICPUDRAFT_54227 [Dictyostelium purpureum]
MCIKQFFKIRYINKFQFLEDSDDGEQEEMNRTSLKKKKKTNKSNKSNVEKEFQAKLKETEEKFKLYQEQTENQLDGLAEENTPKLKIIRENIVIKDIQSYLLWLMLRFKVSTPNWVFTTMSPLISKVVVVSIQGFSQLMYDKVCLLSGRDIFGQVFQETKVELQLPNYNHIFDNLLFIKTHKAPRPDPSFKKEIEPKSFYLLNDEQLIENGYFNTKDLKEGWIYSKQVESIVNILNNKESSTSVGDGADQDSLTLINNLHTEVKEMLAIDCEMCRTQGGELELTRISIVNEKRKVVLDEFVLPEREIIDYLTQYSGITKETLEKVTNRLPDIHKKLYEIIGPNTVLVGHSLENDLKAMKFIHRKIIDTAVLFPTGSSGKFPLKYLTKKYLNRIIQNKQSGHDSIEDAKAVMELVQLKIQRGKTFGTKLESSESFFDKIHKFEKKSSFIDRLDDIKTYTSQVVSCFGCATDNEVIEKTIKQSSANSPSDFICCQLTDLNDHFKDLLPKPININTVSKSINNTPNEKELKDTPLLSEKEIKEIQQLDGIEITPKVKSIVFQMENQIKKLHEKLEKNTLLMLILGPGPTNDINRFRAEGNKQNDYLLSVETAKEGYAFLTIKQ